MRRPTPSGFLSIVLLTIAALANTAIPRHALGDVRDRPNAAICIGLAARSYSAADFDPDDEDSDGLTNTTEQTRTFTDPCWADTDEDGLLDSWEVDPAKVNPAMDKAGFNLDSDPEIEAIRDDVFAPYAENGFAGTIDASLRPSPSFSQFVHPPDPLHKDIYFELDWQDCLTLPTDCPEPPGSVIAGIDPTHHAPSIAAIQDVVDVFHNAPVTNPDGKAGIGLHILVDEGINHIPICDRGTSAVRGLFFGTTTQRASANASNILQAKARAFRYIWSGHSTTPTPSPNDAPDATPPCNKPGAWDFLAAGLGYAPLPDYDWSPFGDANIGGKDILVSLGPLWVCPTSNKTFGAISLCFRNYFPSNPWPAKSGIGIFPAQVPVNGQPKTFRWPIQLLIGVSEKEGIRQLWGRSLMHLIGHSLGLSDIDALNNDIDLQAFDSDNDGDLDPYPPHTYRTWNNLLYAPSADPNDYGTPAPIEHYSNYDNLSLADTDGDSVPEGVDNCPSWRNPTQGNLDGDSFGDACDVDKDGDGIQDEPAGSTSNARAGAMTQGNGNTATTIYDSHPFDTDNDGIDNANDPDDDADGVQDTGDNCKLITNANQTDTDRDGVGDTCDEDDDNDTIPDQLEIQVGSNPTNAASLPEVLGKDNVCTDGSDNDRDSTTDATDTDARTRMATPTPTRSTTAQAQPTTAGPTRTATGSATTATRRRCRLTTRRPQARAGRTPSRRAGLCGSRHPAMTPRVER